MNSKHNSLTAYSYSVKAILSIITADLINLKQSNKKNFIFLSLKNLKSFLEYINSK